MAALRAAGLAALLFALSLDACRALRLSAQPAIANVAGKKGATRKVHQVMTKPFNGSLFFMHLPKAAGDSFLSDAPKYFGRYLKGSETNYCKARSGSNGTLERNVVAMVRDPRAHVLSMYFHCKTGHEYVLQGWHTRMPDRIIEWLRPWAKAGSDDSSEVLHRFCCYSPVNLQSRRFSCSQGFDVAKRHVEKAFFVGVVEHYHLSVCLFGTKVRGAVPEGCACEGKGSVQSRELDSHLNHGVQLHSASHLPASHLELIDNMTREDNQIYELARKRLWAEVERVERIYKVRVACGEERRLLRIPRAALLRPQRAAADRAQARPRAPPPAEPVRARPPARAPQPLASEGPEAEEVAAAAGAAAAAAGEAAGGGLAQGAVLRALPPAANLSLAATAPRFEAVAAPMPHVRARVPARPGRAAAPLPGQTPAGPPLTDLHLLRVPARAHLAVRQGVSLLDLGAQAAADRGAGQRGGCPNEGYLLHGTGAGR